MHSCQLLLHILLNMPRPIHRPMDHDGGGNDEERMTVYINVKQSLGSEHFRPILEQHMAETKPEV